jgi:hypothetical protein
MVSRRIFDSPLARASENHLDLLYQPCKGPPTWGQDENPDPTESGAM